MIKVKSHKRNGRIVRSHMRKKKDGNGVYGGTKKDAKDYAKMHPGGVYSDKRKIEYTIKHPQQDRPYATGSTTIAGKSTARLKKDLLSERHMGSTLHKLGYKVHVKSISLTKIKRK